MAGNCIKTRKMKKIMLDNGFMFIGCNGDHFKYKRNNDVVIITKNMNPIITQRLIRTYGLITEK